MVSETSTQDDDLELAADVRELAGRISWRGAASALGLSLDAVRMLGADPTRCHRGTKTQARARLAELSALEKGAA